MTYVSVLISPIGLLIIEADDNGVNFIGFRDETPPENPNEHTKQASTQLQEYFNGSRTEFDFKFGQPGTEFQQKVWAELLKIPAGKPISYTKLSHIMQNPLAIRAIASANGKNNLMILVPCHRVIGKNGDLVGYAGGLWRKKWLLEHEAKLTGLGQSVLNF